MVNSALLGLQWPKSMRWPGATLRWIRPLTSILCIYDGAVVPSAIDGVPVGRTTRGHRFLSPGTFCVSSATEYLEKLPQAYVVIDQQLRREQIRRDLDRRAAELNVAVKPDSALLDEVTGLAEFPVVLAGVIDPGFMTLPAEVLEAAMRTHQRYFSCVAPDGRAAPHFLFVADNLPEDGGAAIVAGNEQVLRARLADARFFWEQDRKIRLEDRIEALKGRVYHAKLGSVYDKVLRVERLAAFLAAQLYPGDVSDVPNLAVRAARLAKTDLSTGMVGEFPELQGIVGRYYAQEGKDREDQRVAEAIADHYKPQGPNDPCPSAPVSVVVALADKIDALVAFFAIGEKPTGSRDPFALRRAAQGVIRIILENELRLPLRAVFVAAAGVVPVDYQNPMEEQNIAGDMLAFIAERLKVHLREEGVRHDLIAAVFALGEDDLVRLLARVRAIDRFLTWDDGLNLLTAYRRATNIVVIEERKDRRRYDGPIDRAFLREPEEIRLEDTLSILNELPNTSFVIGGTTEDFSRAMSALASLRQPVDDFFDRVTVNCDDARLRENRLRLLARIRDTMNRVADFSQIEG